MEKESQATTMSAAADKLVQVDQVRGRAIVKAKEVLACPGLTELKATALCKAVPAATITNRAAKVDGNGSWGLKPKPYSHCMQHDPDKHCLCSV